MRTWPHLRERRELLDEGGIARALGRLADNLLERNPDPARIVLVGIRTCGAHLAERLVPLVSARTGVTVPLGVMDITLYRDDVFVGLPRPEVGPTEIPVDLDGRIVVLVDDVLFTGRTTRSALMELMDFGRPAAVQLAVLVDRGHRELPVQPDFVGLTVETTREQSVRVHLRELHEPDRVVLYEKALSEKTAP